MRPAPSSTAPRGRPPGPMERGLYIAASGMLAEMVRQDQLANDLANASTPGYKDDRVAQRSFAAELDLVNRRTGAPVGGLGLGAEIVEKRVDLTPEVIKDTGEPLDLAIQGEGFFAIQTPQGVRYTRDGSFAADAQNRLIDQFGNPVLGPGNQPVTLRPDGSVDPAAVAVVALQDPRKAGDGRFTGAPAPGGPVGTVRTAALEMSGVDAARTMVDMIGSLRAFEAGQRAITTIDETLRLATGQVGNVPG